MKVGRRRFRCFILRGTFYRVRIYVRCYKEELSFFEFFYFARIAKGVVGIGVFYVLYVSEVLVVFCRGNGRKRGLRR